MRCELPEVSFLLFVSSSKTVWLCLVKIVSFISLHHVVVVVVDTPLLRVAAEGSDNPIS